MATPEEELRKMRQEAAMRQYREKEAPFISRLNLAATPAGFLVPALQAGRGAIQRYGEDIEKQPTGALKARAAITGLPGMLGEAMAPVYEPAKRAVSEFITGREYGAPAPVSETPRVPTPTVTTGQPTQPEGRMRPKIGLPQDFVGKAGDFDVSRQGDVQVIRGPGASARQATISPLEAAKYQLEANKAQSQIGQAQFEEQMGIRELIDSSPVLADIAPTAYRMSQQLSGMTGLDVPYILSVMEEIGQEIDPDMTPMDKAALLQRAVEARLRQEAE